MCYVVTFERKMKHLSVFLAVLILGQAVAVPFFTLSKPSRATHKPDIDKCSLCINFSGQFINQLLNIILNAGVVGGCGELCELLAEKVNSKAAGEVCDVLCSIVGVKEFMDLVEKADLDPIYYCELLKACPINDYGDATITSLTVSPTSGPQGTTFEITMIFTSRNGTGTGELVVEVDTVDGMPVGDAELSEPRDPGSYNATWYLHAEPDPDCDPTQQFCEMWLPGIYNVTTAVCNGQCGSSHPHSKEYDRARSTFTLTRNFL